MASDKLAAAALLATVLFPGSRRLLRSSQVERRDLSGLRADLYVPARTPAPGIVLVLGALREGRRYPILESTAHAIAARGFAVMVPELGRLRQMILGLDALDDLVIAAQSLPRIDGVIESRVGLIGFSLGGSLALLAAADDRLRDRVATVAAMGSYFRLTEMLDCAVSGFGGPGDVPMTIAAPSAYAVAASLIARLQDPDRTILLRIIEQAPDAPLAALSRVELSSVGDDGRTVLKLLRDGAAGATASLILNLNGLGEMMAALSPESAIGRIEAPVWILHDERDRYVPFDQFRAMREAARGYRNFTFLGIRLLEHTEPVSPALNPGVLIHDYLPGVTMLYRFAHGPLAAVRRAATSQLRNE